MRAVLLAVLIALVAATMFASTAKASRAPTAAERKAVARAFDPGYPDRCLFIRVSTKGPYAGILNAGHQPTTRNRAWCNQHGYIFDGAAIYKRTNGMWRQVTAGSALEARECRKLPAVVLRDMPVFAAGLGCRVPKV